VYNLVFDFDQGFDRQILQEIREISNVKILSGWWFQTMDFYDFPYIGNSNPN